MYNVIDGQLWWGDKALGSDSTIYVDARQTGLVKPLPEGFLIKRLEVGDYVFVTRQGRVVGVEEKKGSDLGRSWRTRRLQRQLRRLIKGVEIPILGYRTECSRLSWRWDYSLGDIVPDRLALDLAKWEALGGISVWLPPDLNDVLSFLQELRTALQPKPALLSVLAGGDKKKVPDMPSLAVSLHKLVAGIGPILGTKLAERYGQYPQPLIAALIASDTEWRELGANRRVLENRGRVLRGEGGC